MKILLLSAYDASSHRYWREQLVAHLPEHAWTVLALPPRYFRWRIRGNSLSWGLGHTEVLAAGYDLVLATSMVDVAALKGLVPQLAGIPWLVYFHENQFAYPAQQEAHASIEPCIVNLYSALAAQHVLFNSQYNRDSFLEGVDALLNKLPDHVPAGLVQRLHDNSAVLPVPLAADCYQVGEPTVNSQRRVELVWNHRWEYDKGPERLRALIVALQQANVPFRLHLLGQQFRRHPGPMLSLQQLLKPEQRGHWGFIENRAEYLALLRRCDVVISTALHDFQGLSVLEAVASGCLPLVPSRLCYPEWFGTEACYASFEDDIDAEAAAAVTRLQQMLASPPSRPGLEHFHWDAALPAWRDVIAAVVAAPVVADREANGYHTAPS